MMGLTLEKLQRMERIGAVDFFQDRANRAKWTTAARDAYGFVKKGFKGEGVRPDDVLDPLITLVEIDEDFRNFLSSKKLGQKYWISDFADLILDVTWPEIAK